MLEISFQISRNLKFPEGACPRTPKNFPRLHAPMFLKSCPSLTFYICLKRFLCKYVQNITSKDRNKFYTAN